MSNQIPDSSFPATRQDLSNLKKTAVDAVKDVSSTASVHAERAKDHLKDLASHVQEEGGEQLGQVKVRFDDLANAARDYISARPLASVGVALAAGFLFGVVRRSCSSED